MSRLPKMVVVPVRLVEARPDDQVIQVPASELTTAARAQLEPSATLLSARGQSPSSRTSPSRGSVMLGQFTRYAPNHSSTPLLEAGAPNQSLTSRVREASTPARMRPVVTAGSIQQSSGSGGAFRAEGVAAAPSAIAWGQGGGSVVNVPMNQRVFLGQPPPPSNAHGTGVVQHRSFDRSISPGAGGVSQQRSMLSSVHQEPLAAVAPAAPEQVRSVQSRALSTSRVRPASGSNPPALMSMPRAAGVPLAQHVLALHAGHPQKSIHKGWLGAPSGPPPFKHAAPPGIYQRHQPGAVFPGQPFGQPAAVLTTGTPRCAHTDSVKNLS
eukprot:gnl/TRDRNA2_/TRDRNA2_166450_c3_seq1.p1 gnl/TRDRNA2_/TRDRNA2_166450_c3~~gnl/TRDRNA2_/TRDRNA2_166450_c3_seq1.p1  ORF type:complete len:338 (-),score=43.94 gnl/TRDRNA2_/TRDRNA2_166450_c3_seq1:242-1216(-)